MLLCVIYCMCWQGKFILLNLAFLPVWKMVLCVRCWSTLSSCFWPRYMSKHLFNVNANTLLMTAWSVQEIDRIFLLVTYRNLWLFGYCKPLLDLFKMCSIRSRSKFYFCTNSICKIKTWDFLKEKNALWKGSRVNSKTKVLKLCRIYSITSHSNQMA